jgi:hypothetical protein
MGSLRREAVLTLPAFELISSFFHTTTDNDDDIAATLTAQGIPISDRQVKRARLSQGWLRRNNNIQQSKQSPTFTDTFKEDPHFETKKLGNTNELTVNICFA